MQESSNIGTAQIADQVGAARQRGIPAQDGLPRSADIELKERGRTIKPRDWSRLDVMTVGYGYSMAITPVHLATGYATLITAASIGPATMLKVDA